MSSLSLTVAIAIEVQGVVIAGKPNVRPLINKYGAQI